MAGQRKQTVGDFEILDYLGGGSFGKVHRVLDQKLGRHFAMKIIPLGLKSKEKDFELECSLLRDLHHPGIIALHQAFIDSYDSLRCGFIVTDIADGTLHEPASAEQTVPAVYVQLVARQLLEALGYMHDRRIVHGDIKPANILCFHGDIVKLCDFGLAYKLPVGQAAHFASLRGTHMFMAAEQFSGSLDCPADVWSLGATLYQLSTGQFPFCLPESGVPKAVKAGYIAYQALHCDLLFPGGVHPLLKDFIQVAMSKDPQLRPTCKQLKSHAFVACDLATFTAAEIASTGNPMLAPHHGPESPPQQEERPARPDLIPPPPNYAHMAQPDQSGDRQAEGEQQRTELSIALRRHQPRDNPAGSFPAEDVAMFASLPSDAEFKEMLLMLAEGLNSNSEEMQCSIAADAFS